VSKEGTGNFLVDRFEGWFTAVWRSYWPWLLFCGLSAAAFRSPCQGDVDAPTFDPSPGTYTGAQSVPGNAGFGCSRVHGYTRASRLDGRDRSMK